MKKSLLFDRKQILSSILICSILFTGCGSDGDSSDVGFNPDFSLPPVTDTTGSGADEEIDDSTAVVTPNTGESIESELVNGLDPDFISIIDGFIAQAAERNINLQDEIAGLRMVYAFQPDGIAGVCFVGQNMIEIDPSFRSGTSRLFLEELIYHELGHCVLGMEHRGGGDNGQNFPSIMQAVDFVSSNGVLTDALLDEFFQENLFGELDGVAVNPAFRHTKNHDHGYGVDHEHNHDSGVFIKTF